MVRWCPALPPCPPLYLASHPVQSSLSTSHHHQHHSDLSLSDGPERSMWHPPPPHPSHQEQFRSHHSKSDHSSALKCSPSHKISILSSSLPSLLGPGGLLGHQYFTENKIVRHNPVWERKRRLFFKKSYFVVFNILCHFLYKV